jgi:hypothetical protein
LYCDCHHHHHHLYHGCFGIAKDNAILVNIGPRLNPKPNHEGCGCFSKTRIPSTCFVIDPYPNDDECIVDHAQWWKMNNHCCWL